MHATKLGHLNRPRAIIDSIACVLIDLSFVSPVVPQKSVKCRSSESIIVLIL